MNTQVHTLIGAYALDAVDEAERQLVEEHLTSCVECAQEVREWRATAARLADATITEPPQRMRDNVMFQIRRTRQEPPEEGSPQAILRPKRIRPWRSLVAASALAAVMALAGAAVTYVWMQDQVSGEREESDQISEVLTAADADVSVVDADGGGQVTVVASASHDQAVVVVSELEQVGDDRAYQLWLADEDGQESAGVMPAGDQSATMLVSGIADFDLIGVTNEPAGGSSTPTLPMVADVELEV